MLRLLTALEHPIVFSMMQPYGLESEVLDRGWALLREHARAQPGPASRGAARGNELLDQLNAWEDRWFPIADASLRSRHARAHGRLFLNLRRTRGLQVIVSVGVFVERLHALRADRSKASQDAVRLLGKRGLNEGVIGQAEELLDQARSLRPPAQPAARLPSKADARQAEQAMWNWTLEWSQICRTVIRDPRWRRHLGFGTAGRPPKQGRRKRKG